jgi:hypothetical protein
MKATRREFDAATSLEIVKRATSKAGMTHCEACGAWCKSRRDYQIDHVIHEGIRPPRDKRRRLKAVEGQLLCVDCHKRKTGRETGDRAKAKRLEAKQPPAVGPTWIQRRYGLK